MNINTRYGTTPSIFEELLLFQLFEFNCALLTLHKTLRDIWNDELHHVYDFMKNDKLYQPIDFDLLQHNY